MLLIWTCKGICNLVRSPLPNNKNLGMLKAKAFADGKSSVAQMMLFVSERVENTVGKVVLFPNCFQKSSSPGS